MHMQWEICFHECLISGRHNHSHHHPMRPCLSKRAPCCAAPTTSTLRAPAYARCAPAATTPDTTAAHHQNRNPAVGSLVSQTPTTLSTPAGAVARKQRVGHLRQRVVHAVAVQRLHPVAPHVAEHRGAAVHRRERKGRVHPAVAVGSLECNARMLGGCSDSPSQPLPHPNHLQQTPRRLLNEHFYYVFFPKLKTCRPIAVNNSIFSIPRTS